MSTKELLKLIDEKFETKLQERTGWGKNDVINAYRQCVNEVILESMDRKSTSNE